MSKPNTFNLVLVGLAALSLVGCENLPGSKGTQGAVIGGTGGAAVGALAGGEHHRLLGALIGGALGTAGGYVVGANSDRILGHDQNGARQAARNSQEHPATPQQALAAPTADINGDGFVTMDEIVAMKQAGLTDAQMLQKLQATGQVFDLTPQQQQYLSSQGVDQYVLDQMPQLNRATRDRLLSAPPGTTPYPAGNYPPPAYTPAPGYNPPPAYNPAPTYTPPVGTPSEPTPPVNYPPINNPPTMAPPVVGQPPTLPPPQR